MAPLDNWVIGSPSNGYADSASTSLNVDEGSLSLYYNYDSSAFTKAIYFVEDTWDMSAIDSFSVNLNVNGAVDRVSVALTTGSGYQWFESELINVNGGANTLVFQLKGSDWKSEASGWTYTTDVSDLDDVKRIAIIFLFSGNDNGDVVLNSWDICSSSDSTSTSSMQWSSTDVDIDPVNTPEGFVGVYGKNFVLDNCEFRYVGTNNYYLMYKTDTMVRNVYTAMNNIGLKVVRMWGFIDIGTSDGGGSIDGIKDGKYFHFWTGSQPAYNDASNGLERIDFAISEAAKAGIKLIIVLTNNWAEFGGMDQYNVWYENSFHDDFYVDADVKTAYKNWITHFVNRVNSITGIRYRDDPTIMAWELANEPRCTGGNKEASSSCNTATITSWITEMSSYLRSIDSKHLIALGDEGFLNNNGESWLYDGSEGIDFEENLKIPSIDFGTFHMYPEHWGQTNEWGKQWIQEHIEVQNRVNKPVIIEEFGTGDKSNRQSIMEGWFDEIQKGLAGDHFWMIAAADDSGTNYPDYDGFTIYQEDSIVSSIQNHIAIVEAMNVCYEPISGSVYESGSISGSAYASSSISGSVYESDSISEAPRIDSDSENAMFISEIDTDEDSSAISFTFCTIAVLSLFQ